MKRLQAFLVASCLARSLLFYFLLFLPPLLWVEDSFAFSKNAGWQEQKARWCVSVCAPASHWDFYCCYLSRHARKWNENVSKKREGKRERKVMKRKEGGSSLSILIDLQPSKPLLHACIYVRTLYLLVWAVFYRCLLCLRWPAWRSYPKAICKMPSEPQVLSHDVPELHKIRQCPNIRALKLWNDRSGIAKGVL